MERKELGRKVELHGKWASSVGKDGEQLKLEDADLHGADLARANLTDAEIPGVNLDGAKLTNADLHGANVASASFRNADLQDANLSKANGDYAVFTGARLWGAKLFRGSFVEADFSKADLRGADLRHGDFTDAKLDGTNLAGVLREGATGLPAGPKADPADTKRARDLLGELQDAHAHYDDPDKVAERKARDQAEARKDERELEEFYRKTGQKPKP
jgi:uncharacterized protein YjbI with pentapeptide repeats